jgi:glycosyltransferase involved in cell wall biosynthesis
MPKSKLFRPDVTIISSLSLLTILNGYWMKKRLGCKLVFEIRDIWPLTIIEEGGFNRRNPLVMFLAWVERFGYEHSDIIVGTMPNLAEHVQGVTGSKLGCHYVPFGFDPELYSNKEPLPKEYEERYIPKNKFIIGYAGSIGITNALDTLMKCASRMKDDPQMHFLLLGDGDLLDEYKSKTRDLRNITFAPKVGKAQVQAVLKHCDVLYLSVLDSKVWRYGLSLNKIIDYLMAGKPVIGSYNGYPSMINEADCGVFIPAEDVTALEQAIYEYRKRPKEELELIGARGREWLITNRPYAKIAQNYLEVLKQG